MTRRKLSIALAVTSAICLLMHGCLSVPRISARGTVAGYALSGPVDSRVARDYLEGRPLPEPLQRTRQRYLTEGRVPSREQLAELSDRYSPDVATLLFIETVSASPENQALQRRFDSELALVRRVGVQRAKPNIPDDLLVLFVPGWFYETNGSDTNADYRIQRRVYDRWRLPHRLVPVNENGSVEDNARVVADAIRAASTHHRIFLVSASKSGAEVALSLGRELERGEARAVVGWLSIGGVVRGSPLADRALEPDLCWLVRLKLGADGFDLHGLESMQTANLRPAFDALRLPPHVRVISYVPAPLSGHVSERGSIGYRWMRHLGPNDGLTLLADERIPGAVSLLAPGVDHFLGSRSEQNVWSTALLRMMVADLDTKKVSR